MRSGRGSAGRGALCSSRDAVCTNATTVTWRSSLMIGAENEPWKNQNIVFPAWSCSSASSLAPPDSVSEP